MADGQLIEGTSAGNIFACVFMFFQGYHFINREDWSFIMSVILFFLAAGAYISTIRKNTKKDGQHNDKAK